MDESKEREAFERWAIDNHHAYRTERGTLIFIDDDELGMWTGWEGHARAVLAQPEPEPVASIRWPYELMWHTDKPPSGWIPCYTKPLSQPEPELPAPGSPKASAMIDSLLDEYQWPTNSWNAARAGYEAARRLLAGRKRREG